MEKLMYLVWLDPTCTRRARPPSPCSVRWANACLRSTRCGWPSTSGTRRAIFRPRSRPPRVRHRCTGWSRCGSTRRAPGALRRGPRRWRRSWPAIRWWSPSTATTGATGGRPLGTGPMARAHRGAHGRHCSASTRTGLRRVDHAVAHPDLADHRGDPAALSLRPQRRLPAGDRRGPTDSGASWRKRGPPSTRRRIRCCSIAPTAIPNAWRRTSTRWSMRSPASSTFHPPECHDERMDTEVVTPSGPGTSWTRRTDTTWTRRLAAPPAGSGAKWADLFTEDAVYLEHSSGPLRARRDLRLDLPADGRVAEPGDERLPALVVRVRRGAWLVDLPH